MAKFYEIEKKEKQEEDKLVDLGQVELTCVDCNTSSIIIQKAKDLPITTKIKMQCFCGGSSFVHTFSGKIYIAAKEGFYIEDIEYNSEKPSIIRVKK